jgi:high-affinity iron transporter
LLESFIQTQQLVESRSSNTYMMQISLIIFRELLEVLLLLFLIVATAHGRVKNLKLYVFLGCVVGVFGAIILALTAPLLASSFSGMGQEIVNSTIIFTTAMMLAATILYMKNYYANLKNNIKTISLQLEESLRYKILLVLLIATAIFREGSEIVLLLYGITLANQVQLMHFILAISLGSVVAILCGFLFYKGLLKTANLFRITSMLLIFISSNMTAESIGILNRAGIIEILPQQAWDLSWLISDNGFIGNCLRALINYNSKPSVLEVLVFMITFCTIFYLNNIKKQTIQINTKND